jgi:hypothetical protein
MPRNTLASLAFMLWLALLAAPAAAQGDAQDAPLRPEDSYTVTFYDENDFFAGTDEHYTNAFHISVLSKDLPRYAQEPFLREHAPWLARALESIPLMSGRPAGTTYNVGFSFGNSIYTPVATREEALQADDRPYAGHSYAALALHAKNATRLDSFEIAAGIVGPSSGGKFVQDSWHRLINKFRSRGWDHQLHDEPTLNLTWQRIQRPLRVDLGRGWAADALPHYGGTLGNVFTYANAGGQVRLGRNLPADFGVSLIRPGAIVGAPGDPGDPQVTGELGYNVFAGVDGRAVARNIFLDGNTWRHSHSVTRKPFVADVFCGVSVIWRRWTFTYTHVYRSPEFEGQHDGQVFGSFSVGYTF